MNESPDPDLLIEQDQYLIVLDALSLCFAAGLQARCCHAR
jgi:hypothetical protein